MYKNFHTHLHTSLDIDTTDLITDTHYIRFTSYEHPVNFHCF